jgi:hypothetical protein
MKLCVAATAVPIALFLVASPGVIVADTLRLCVKPEGQVRLVGPGEACRHRESLIESAGALRFVDAEGREIGPWVDLNAAGFPITDQVAGDFWVLAATGRDFSKNVGEIDYDAPDCDTGGGAPYLLAQPNPIMRNGIVIEGRLGFTTTTLVYPANPVQAVSIKSRLLMSSNGTVTCFNTSTGVPVSVGPLASMGLSFTAPFKLVR